MLMSETAELSAEVSSFSPFSKKSTEQMKKIPTIVLSVSYKGVKFIDATNKVNSFSYFPIFLTPVFLNRADIEYINTTLIEIHCFLCRFIQY